MASLGKPNAEFGDGVHTTINTRDWDVVIMIHEERQRVELIGASGVDEAALADLLITLAANLRRHGLPDRPVE